MNRKWMIIKDEVNQTEINYLTAGGKWTTNKEFAYVFDTPMFTACQIAARHGGRAIEFTTSTNFFSKEG